MSEEQSPSAPVAETGSPTFADDGAVTLGDVTFPPVEAAPVDPPATEPTPEPAAAPAEVDPFAPVKLENGDYELKLETGERFVGKTEAELASNIARSRLEANKYIQTLKNPPVPEPPKTQTAEVDPAALAILDMIAPGLGLPNGAALAESLKQLRESQAGFTEVTQQARDNQTAADFFRSTPDFVGTQANIERLGEALDGMGLPFTLKNAQFAHFALKGRGAYEAAPATPPAEAAPRTAGGQFAPKANPLPPTGAAPSPSSKAAPSEAEMWNMTSDQLMALAFPQAMQ